MNLLKIEKPVFNYREADNDADNFERKLELIGEYERCFFIDREKFIIQYPDVVRIE